MGRKSNDIPELGSAARRLAQSRARPGCLDERLRQLKSGRARKDGNHRKLLAGAILLDTVDAGDFAARTFRQWLDQTLTRNDERELFGLNID